MTRSELEHVIRAAGAIADEQEIVVIGSQSILGQFQDATAALLAPMEADNRATSRKGGSHGTSPRDTGTRGSWGSMSIGQPSGEGSNPEPWLRELISTKRSDRG